MDESTYMVNVLCMTYNQASFIEDAFNAFTMQQTTFPFVCTIIDDASNDGEQNVIKTYLKEHFDPVDQSTVSPSDTPDYHFLFARHKTQPNCYFAVYFLNYNHFGTAVLRQRKLRYAAEWFEKSKYIAFCEGDDFWTDPRKLEKQVDFLGTSLKLLYVAEPNQVIDKRTIALHLKSRLESYKIPQAYEQVASIRMTYNGKKDRKSYKQ